MLRQKKGLDVRGGQGFRALKWAFRYEEKRSETEWIHRKKKLRCYRTRVGIFLKFNKIDVDSMFPGL